MTAGGMKGSGRWAGYTSKGRSGGDHDEYRALTMELLDMRYAAGGAPAARCPARAHCGRAGARCVAARRGWGR